MKLSLVSYNGHNINDSNPFASYIPVGQLGSVSKTPVLVNRSLDEPFLSTVVRNGSVLIIGVYIKGDVINTYREVLKQYFFGDDNRHTIIALDEQSGNQFYRVGIPVRLVQEAEDRPNSFYITIQTENQYWQLVTASVDSWDISASGDSDVISNSGNLNIAPVFTITPTMTKTSGLKYRRFLPITNNLDKSYVAPLDVLNNSFDAQALINSNKLQSSGQDFRIWIDGSFTDNWFYFDSSITEGMSWVNYNLSPRKYSTISTSIDSDDTTLTFPQTKSGLKFLQSIKNVSNRVLQIENEFVTFSDSDIDVFNYQITNITRGQKDSTNVSHSSSTTIKHVEHDTWCLYGDSDLVAYENDDDYKPLIDIDDSINTDWIPSYFSQVDTNRSAGWTPEVLSSRTGLSYIYTGNYNTFIDPTEFMGMALIGSSDFQVQNETGTLAWSFSHPAGVKSIEYDVNKYNTGSWPAIVGLQVLNPGIWFTIKNESAPSTVYTWELISYTDSDVISLGGTYETIRFTIDGLLSSTINEAALATFYAYHIYLDSDNLPSFSMGSETSINFFDFTLYNNTSGEFIKVTTPCLVNQSLTIDCENKEAYLSDGSRVNVILSSNRDAWLDLSPGNNSLSFVDVGTAGVHINISHRDKVL